MKTSLDDPAWKRIKLSLVPPNLSPPGGSELTLAKDKDKDKDELVRPPKLEAVTPDGDLQYENEEESSTKLSSRVHRIWAERGDFSELTAESIRHSLKVDHATQDKVAGDGSEGTEEKEEERKRKDKGKAKELTETDVFRLKETMWQMLESARGDMEIGRILIWLLQPPADPSVPSTSATPASASPVPSGLPFRNTAPASTVPDVELPFPQGFLAATQVQPPSSTDGETGPRGDFDRTGDLSAPTPSSVGPNALRDARLLLASKRSSLRSAASVFSSAASSLFASSAKSRDYWDEAIRLKKAGWKLHPAQPLGRFVGPSISKGPMGQREAKDFIVVYGSDDLGLGWRRRAFAHLAEEKVEEGLQGASGARARASRASDSLLVFHGRLRRRMRVGMSARVGDQTETWWGTVGRTPGGHGDSGISSRSLREAQVEMFEEELFAELLREVRQTPSLTADVSEKLLVIEVCDGIELKLEMVDNDTSSTDSQDVSRPPSGISNLLLYLLHLLLRRLHRYRKLLASVPSTVASTPNPSNAGTPRQGKVGRTGTFGGRAGLTPAAAAAAAADEKSKAEQAARDALGPPPKLLKPVLTLFQYLRLAFSVQAMLKQCTEGLERAGVKACVEWTPVTEGGKGLMREFVGESDDGKILGKELEVGGSAAMRIEDRYTLSISFSTSATAPLVIHLPHTDLPLPSLASCRMVVLQEIRRLVDNEPVDLTKTRKRRSASRDK